MMKSGARLLLDELERQGVSTIFGYPGATVLPVYDELYDSPLRHVLVRHEQAAAHAADGYARASGCTGVCIATSGPGACNLVTGIATACMDSSPVVALTGQVPTSLLGNDAFQEADITGIVAPITKHAYLVKRTDELVRRVREAFLIAGTGRRGPVLVDLPKDVLTGMAADEPDGPDPVLAGYRPTPRGHPRQVRAAAELIARAERPVIYAGGGVIASGASAVLVRLAERCLAPVTTTLMALGAVPADHPLNLGMLGMHGTVQANLAITECDLLVAIGARFDDRVTGRLDAFAPRAAVVHVDIDPAEIGKNRAVDVPIVGDARTVLEQLLAALGPAVGAGRRAWHRWCADRRRPSPAVRGSPDAIAPQAVIEALNESLPASAVVVSEVGQHQMWTANTFRFRRPRQWITSGGLGTMGFGLPAAMGASCALPDAPVVVVAGDGSLQMNIQEFGTLVQHRIPVKVVVMNNGFLGMVRQWQELFYDRRYAATELPSVDFVGIARAYGIDGIRVETADEMDGAIRAAIEIDGPFLVDIRIEREANVFPMVPAGAAINEMIDGSAWREVRCRPPCAGTTKGPERPLRLPALSQPRPHASPGIIRTDPCSGDRDRPLAEPGRVRCNAAEEGACDWMGSGGNDGSSHHLLPRDRQPAHR
ncbi:Acetolactate synthase large subunit [anaerobic digester metagenome]